MADRVELIVQLTGNQQAISSLREMQQLVNSLNTKKVQLKLDAAEIDRQLADKKRMLQELTARRHEIKLSGGDVTQVSKEIDKLKDEISELTRQKKHIAIDARLNTEALSQGNAELRDMERNANTVADAIRGIGSALSTVGGLSSTIGSIFGQMASLAGGDMMNTVVRTLTGYGTILATQGLGTASSRFDTFRTFPRVMEVMGYSVDQTDAAVKRLEQSVLGLPTSLNDIIDMARDFILLTNDLDRGVDLATSINNLFVAGGADSEQVRIGLKQFRDLLSKGSLMDREWDSLARTLGVSLRFIASEAGYAEEQFGEFRTALKSGEIGVEEFLDAVVRAGSSGRVKSVLEEMKDTLTATLTNLRTAFANLGATVLTEFDDLLSRETGGGLPDTILSISNAIKQQLIPAVREWIAINSDRLFAIFDWIRSFDWGALLRGIADNVLYVVEKLLAFADAIGHENIIWFFSHGTQWAMMARQFQILGAALSSLGGIVSTVGAAIGGLKTAMAGISAAGGLAAVGSAAAPYIAVAGAVSIGIGLIADGYKRGTAAAKEYTDTVRESLEATDLNVAHSKAIVETVDGVISSTTAAYDEVERKAIAAKTLAQEIISLGAAGDTSMLAQKVAELSALFPDIKVELDEVTGRLTLNGKAAAEAAEGYAEYITATEQAAIAAEAIRELMEEKLNIEVQIELNEAQIGELEEKLEAIRAKNREGKQVNIFESIDYQKTVKAAEEDLQSLRTETDELHAAAERVDAEIGAWTGRLNDATAAADANVGAIEKIQESVDGTSSTLDALRAKYAELQEAARESFASQIQGFGELEQVATEKIGNMIDAQDKNAEYIGTYSDNLRTLLDYIEEQGENLSPNVARMLSEAVGEGLSGAGSVAAIAEAIEADDESFKKLAAAYEKEFLAAAEAADLTAAIQTVASAFTEAYDQIIKEGSLFGENGLTIFSETDLENIKQEASTVVQALQDGINEIFAGGEDAAQGITLFSEDTIKAMITPMYEALANEDTGLTASFIALKEIMVSLYDETVPELIEAFEELLEAVEELREAVEELTEAIEDLIDAIEELISVLKDAKKEIDRWRVSIERLTDVINAAIPVIQSMTGEVEAFTAAVNEAIDAVNSLASATAGLGDMSVSVPSGGGGSSFNTHTSGNRAVPYSTGGPVYLARGGSLWIPRGTDTVPAMLTPGEFVLRRKAVQKLGVPFLNMLNKLDIPRAIDALMSRVVLPSGMNYVTYDNRRTYDNHATVNQNIYTNNPDYAYRRASRWAHGL